MNFRTLRRRSLTYYWRTNLVVIAGVAVAVSILSGALLTGESVRASLRALTLSRLGRTGFVVTAPNPFRESLAPAVGGAAPLLHLTGLARHQPTGRLASQVHIYGVDERFWRFHDVPPQGPEGRGVLLSESLARELEAAGGDGILLRASAVSHIPADSLHGRKEDAATTIRFTFAGALGRERLGEFSLGAGQGDVKAAFVPLRRLQQALGLAGRVNTLLLPPGAEAIESRLAESATPDDFGLRVRTLAGRGLIQVDSLSGILSEGLANVVAEAARSAGLKPLGIYTYLANTIRCRGREIPYSLVAATEQMAPGGNPPPITLNEWAARELEAGPGDPITLDYFLWQPGGRLETRTAQFRLTAIRPVERDRELTPDYPGITDSDDVTGWDPPFPVDLGRIRPADERYWDLYRTTPKAFVPLEAGQTLWASPWGRLTAFRMETPAGGGAADAQARLEAALRRHLNPLEHGFTVTPVRALALAASEGATDFGKYFVYFSFFVIVSALLLAGLFFRFGVEQRVRETGLLEAVGLPRAKVRAMLVREGLVLAAAGAVLGIAGAAGYCQVIVYGLRTWWVDAVGTRSIEFHVDPVSLAAGVAGGLVAAVAALRLTLHGLWRVSPRGRLAGVTAPVAVTPSRSAGRVAGAAALLAAGLVGGAAFGVVPPAAGFFGAGSLLLAAGLALLRGRLVRHGSLLVRGNGAAAGLRLAFRNLAYRPGRTVLSVALTASAIFLIVSVDAFRLPAAAGVGDPKSPSGGYALMAESVLPVYRDPATAEGREVLGLAGLPDIRLVPFRLRPGDDVSCLNLYRPQNPRVLGAPAEFLAAGRFRFTASLASTAGERENPWLLLNRPAEGGAIPAAAAANSMTYVLHRQVGDVIEIPGAGGRSVRLRLVAALADTVFQRELIVSDAHFRAAFPESQGYRVFLIEAPEAGLAASITALEERLADFGFDAIATSERLAAFHQVENTYLSTFQSLGTLGLLLGTLGLSAIVLRNALERRREFALLQAVGFSRRAIAGVVLAESLWMLAAGMVLGAAAAVVAILPALSSRGGSFSPGSLALLLGAVAVAGVLSSLAATRAVFRPGLLDALHSE